MSLIHIVAVLRANSEQAGAARRAPHQVTNDGEINRVLCHHSGA